MSRVQSATQHIFDSLANQPDSFPGKQRQNEAAQEEDCIHIKGSSHKKRQLFLRCLQVSLTSSGQDMLNPICTRQLHLYSIHGAITIQSHTSADRVSHKSQGCLHCTQSTQDLLSKGQSSQAFHY